MHQNDASQSPFLFEYERMKRYQIQSSSYFGQCLCAYFKAYNFGFICDFSSRVFSIGDYQEGNNATYLSINDTNQLIQTINQGNKVGLYLGFANNNYYLGDFNDTVTGTSIACTSTQKIVLNASALNNGTTLELDDTNQFIKTSNQANDKGLKLEFANNYYQLGDYGQTANFSYLLIDF